MLRYLFILSFLSSFIASTNYIFASDILDAETDTPYASRMQIRNYSKELAYCVTLKHPILGEKTLEILPQSEKRIENFFPNESFRDRPYSYEFKISCYKDDIHYNHSRTHVELFTLIALFDPKSYDVDSDCSHFTNLRLGRSSFLLPTTLRVNHFTAHESLSMIQGIFPYYKINFNPVSLSQSKSLPPILKTWLDDKRLMLEARLEIHARKNRGKLDLSPEGLLNMMVCFHEGLISNGYLREEQMQTYLRTLTEQPSRTEGASTSTGSRTK